MISFLSKEQGDHGHVDQFRPESVSAVGAPLRQRSDGPRVRSDRADAFARELGRAATDDDVAQGAERDPLFAAERLPLRGLLAIDWRMVPEGVPPRSTVYGYFRRLWQLGIWTRICMALMMAAREQAGKQASPSAAIVDSQSVKTTESGGLKSFDAGKKIMGRKRHLLTDTLGLPPVLIVHAVDIQDRGGLAQVCHRVRRRFPWLTMVSADAGYQYDQAACAAAQQRRRLEVVRRPREQLRSFTTFQAGSERRLHK